MGRKTQPRCYFLGVKKLEYGRIGILLSLVEGTGGLYLSWKQLPAQGAPTVPMYIWEMLYGWVSLLIEEPEERQRNPGYGFKMGMRRESAALKLEIY